MKETRFINSSGPTERYVPLNDAVLVRGRTFPADPFPGTGFSNKYRLPVLATDDGFLVAGYRNGIVVDRYKKQGKGYYRAFTEVVTIDPQARVTNLKRLSDGSLLLAWYREVPNTSMSYTQFSTSKDGYWRTLSVAWDNLSPGMPWLSADFAQDSTGLIQYFAQHDSNNTMCRITLADDLSVRSIELGFVPKGTPLSCEAESPYIVCEPYLDGVILAYHSADYKFFSLTPHLKGARINVTTVSPAGEHLPLYQTPDYAEKLNPFALMGAFIVYCPIDPVTLTYDDLKLLGVDGYSRMLGKTKLPMYFRNSGNSYAHNTLAGKVEVITI